MPPKELKNVIKKFESSFDLKFVHDTLIDIIKIVVMIIKIVGQILAFFPQIIETILLIFSPKKFIDDVIFAISYGIK